MIRSKSHSAIRVRIDHGLTAHAASIADLALEVCEEKLAETRRRKRLPSKMPLRDTSADNPFLSRLGSPFVVSRSMQGQRQNPNNNIHPLKAPRKSSTIPTAAPTSEEAMHKETPLAKLQQKLSVMDAPSYTLLLLFLTLIILPKGLMSLEDRVFNWHRLEDRKLNGRHCVLNLFIHKHKKDEFNPDLKEKYPILPTTYRTKGQMKVVTRLIGCVADSFRNNLNISQHVVFAGSRDGGHLAQEALLHWPQRGTHRTSLHVFADGDSDDSLAYQNLAGIEERFNGFQEYIHLYDQKGNMAGTLESDPEDDDELPEYEKRIPETNLEESNFETLLWDEEESAPEVKSIVPYFHVDGSSMSTQLDILNKAKSLFENHSIAVVGLEHPPDMDINELVAFFTSVNYKTFMLGLRQLSRIDNLCPEILENILDHPYIHNDHGTWLPHGEKQRTTPPFFVAMPKSRHQLEEMTIQHMYDLFSGEGGGGQVKTANDRKAPGKK